MKYGEQEKSLRGENKLGMVLRLNWYFANIIPSQVVLLQLRNVITTLNNITKTMPVKFSEWEFSDYN